MKSLQISVARPGRHLWLVITVPMALLAAVFLLLPYGVAAALVYIGASALATLAVIAAILLRPGLVPRRSWILVAAALVASVIGHCLWYWMNLRTPEAYPIGATLLYLLGYAALVAGLWVYGRQVESDSGALVDSLLVVISAGALGYALLVHPYVGADGEGLWPLLTVSVYPVLDLVLLSFVLKLFFLSARKPLALTIVLWAVLSVLVADVLHAHGIASGWYDAGDPLDILWFATYALLAVAAWHPSANERLTHVAGDRYEPYRRLWIIGLVSILVPTGLLVLSWSDPGLLRVAAISAILLFILMMIRLVLLLQDNRRQSVELEQLTRIDPLTGAANRRWLLDRLELELARVRRGNASVMLAYLDLDYFKQYNDTYGHGAGDNLLFTLVKRWQTLIRDTDLLARVGGEEFVLVCVDTDEAASVALLERLRQAVPAGQTCSAGLTGAQPTDQVHDLLQRADEALYRAKHQGRDRIVVADSCGRQVASRQTNR